MISQINLIRLNGYFWPYIIVEDVNYKICVLRSVSIQYPAFIFTSIPTRFLNLPFTHIMYVELGGTGYDASFTILHRILGTCIYGLWLYIHTFIYFQMVAVHSNFQINKKPCLLETHIKITFSVCQQLWWCHVGPSCLTKTVIFINFNVMLLLQTRLETKISILMIFF